MGWHSADYGPEESPLAGDLRLPGFAHGGEWDTCAPSATLAVVLEAASGPEWRCPGAGHDERLGLVRQWQALESWAAAGKLGVLRSLIREDDQPSPDGWSKSVTHEVALALAMPPQSAEKLMWTAWELGTRLPRIASLLERGVITFPKARVVDEALAALSDADAATAEALIAPELPGKTFDQTEKLAVQAALTVDPESAARRREEAERNRARVVLRRDPSGAANLAGYDLPTDQTLAAHANVCARALEYHDSGQFPGARMDQLRALAYLDLMNGVTAAARIALGQPPKGLGAPSEYGPDDPGADPDPGPDPAPDPGADPDPGGGPGPDPDPDPDLGTDPDPDPDPDPGPDPGTDTDSDPGTDSDPDPDQCSDPEPTPHAHATDPAAPDVGSPDVGSPDVVTPDVVTPDVVTPDAGEAHAPATPAGAPRPPRPTDLVIPLATLLGLAERPGEGHGLGPLDPDLCRSLAAAAVGDPHTTICVTVTTPHGIAIGHGCARPSRRPPPPTGPGDQEQAALPARLNLTIPATRLARLPCPAPESPPHPDLSASPGTKPPSDPAPWTFLPAGGPGPPGGYGAWELTLPGGRRLTIRLEPVATFVCDHRHESHAYQPNGTLRHQVQVRDYECTFPTCSRHARESDFEHARPYDKGGRTCACNAGARSRQCHRVKQSPGWNVTQPRPGWHQWITPAGRIYLQGPKRYPD